MKSFLVITTNLLLGIILLSGQNYLWPTNSSKYLSSTFGEYRAGHFHSGIDIKTDSRVGFPVFAIGNGYIWRIRTSPFGYGRAVYLKLDDGNLAVYGHLDGFNKRIQSYVNTEQLLQKRYSVDIKLRVNELRVFRGDTLAYTGESGTLVPHLHFELRDPLNRPINPLNTNLKINDFTIPTINRLAIVPLDRQSRINGRPTIQVFDVEYKGRKHFILPDTVQIWSAVGLELKTHDTVRGIPNKYAPYGIKLQVDDSLVFRVQYDTLVFDETRFVEVDRDFQLRASGIGSFNRLWLLAGTKAAGIHDFCSGDGILNLSDGFHDVEIEVYDRNLNTSVLTLVLDVVPDFQPMLKYFKEEDDSYRIGFKGDSLDQVSILADWIFKDGTVLRQAVIDSIMQDDSSIALKVSRDNYAEGSILQIKMHSAWLNQSQSFYFNPQLYFPTSMSQPKVSFIHNPQTFLVKIVLPVVPLQVPRCFIQTADQFIELGEFILTPQTYVSEPIPFNLLERAIAIEWRYNRNPEIICRSPVYFRLVTPHTGCEMMSRDSVVTVNFGDDAAFDTLATWIVGENLQLPESEHNVSGCYTLFPLEQPLKSDASLLFILPNPASDLEQIGLYEFDDDKWEYLDDQDWVAEFTLRAPIERTGIFALLRDETPPEITDIFPGDGGNFRAIDVKYLMATVKDALSGLKDDTAIKITLNDKPVIAEYNAPKDYVRYKLPAPLKEGQYTLTIFVTDRAKNTMMKSSTFKIY
jgi:hypothetical protein